MNTCKHCGIIQTETALCAACTEVFKRWLDRIDCTCLECLETITVNLAADENARTEAETIAVGYGLY
jgi:hypothetical protein